MPSSPRVPYWVVGLIVLGVGILVTVLGAVFVDPLDAWLVSLGLPTRRAEALVPLVATIFGVVSVSFFLKAVSDERKRRREAGEAATGWLIGMIALGILIAAIVLEMLILIALLFIGG